MILASPHYDKAHLYKYLNNVWEEIGLNIDFDGTGVNGGNSAINDAGTIFAVGTPNTTNGSVFVYDVNNNPALKIQGGSTIMNGSTSINGNLEIDNLSVIGINTSGKVGIGTNDPARHLTIYANSYPTSQLAHSSSGTGTNNGFEIYQGGSSTEIVNYENGSMSFWTNNTKRMVIQSDGNVGIGTTSPQGKLAICSGAGSNGDYNCLHADTGNSSSYENSNGRILFRQDGSHDMGLVGMSSNDLQIMAGNGNNHVFIPMMEAIFPPRTNERVYMKTAHSKLVVAQICMVEYTHKSIYILRERTTAHVNGSSVLGIHWMVLFQDKHRL